MAKAKDTYGKILKSTGIFGGSQVFNIMIGVLRTKVVSVLLGPNGLGLMSLYQSVVDMLRSVSDLGLSFSAVRDISSAHATNDRSRMAVALSVFRRLLWFTSLLGALLCILFARRISLIAFEDTAHVLPISLLSLAIFATTLSAGQRAILQGVRRIGDMAKANIWGSLLSFVFSTILFLFFGEKAVIPAILIIALTMLSVSAFYTLRLKLPATSLPWQAVFAKGKSMLQLGFYSMMVGLFATASAFLLRSLIRDWSDIDTVGCYQAAWSISAMSLSAIFSAMAADYYPRLCELSHDNHAMTESVNQQYRISLLISSLIVMLMILMAPLIIRLFYTSKFLPSVSLLQWQMLGCFLKVMNWPMAYVVLGKGKGLMFMLIETVWYVVYVAAVCFLWPYFGLISAGYAYLLAHLVYTLLVYLLIRRLCAFRMAGYNIRITLIFSCMIILAFCLTQLTLSSGWMYICSFLLSLLAIVFLLLEFRQILSWQEIKQAIVKRFKR